MISTRPTSPMPPCNPTLRNRPVRSIASIASVVSAAAALIFAVGFEAPAFAADGDDGGRKYSNYFEFQAGWDLIPNQTLQNGPGGQSRVETLDNSFNVGGAVGRHFGDFLRAEVAVSYREGGIDNAGVVTALPADGDISLFAVLANVYADIDLGVAVVPYIGFGIGGGLFKLDVRQKTQGDLEIDDEDAVFVYNAMVGAKVPISEYVDFSLGYRYIAIAGGNGTGAIIAPSPATQQVESEFDAHEVVAGLKFNF